MKKMQQKKLGKFHLIFTATSILNMYAWEITKNLKIIFHYHEIWTLLFFKQVFRAILFHLLFPWIFCSIFTVLVRAQVMIWTVRTFSFWFSFTAAADWRVWFTLVRLTLPQLLRLSWIEFHAYRNIWFKQLLFSNS